MKFLNGTHQEQAGLLDSNAEKFQVGSYYEIDHKHLPRYIPWDLHFIRVGWVTRITDVDVRIWYPTLRSVGMSCSSIGDTLTAVFLDHYYDIDNELVSKVLVRKVPHQEFEEKRRIRSFWVNRKRRFNSHSTLKNESPQVVPAGIPKLGIEQQKLMEGDSGQEKRLKLGSPVVESKSHDGPLVSIGQVGVRRLNREIRPTSRMVQGVRRSSIVPSTPGASHSTRRSVNKFTPEVTIQKIEEISQACEDHNDKNSAFVVSLTDSEDDIAVLSDSKTSSKFKNLSRRNEGLQRNKKPETLEQTIDTRLDANKSDSLSDEKMQQIINELLKVGLSKLDVGKAAEFCYNDPTKAKVLFGLPSHLRRSYVLGILYPPS